MTAQEIPSKTLAIAWAAGAKWEKDSEIELGRTEYMIAAVAPSLKAQAIREVAERIANEIDGESDAIPALEGWADELDPKS